MNNGKSNKFLWAIYVIIIVAFVAIGVNSFTGKSSNEVSMMAAYESYMSKPAYSETKAIGLENSVYYLNTEEIVPVKVLSNNGDSLKWTSSDNDICTVDEHGRITGFKPGRVKIVASLKDGESVTIDVVIVDDSKTTIDKVKKQDAKEYAKELAKEYETTPLDPSKPTTIDSDDKSSSGTPSAKEIETNPSGNTNPIDSEKTNPGDGGNSSSGNSNSDINKEHIDSSKAIDSTTKEEKPIKPGTSTSSVIPVSSIKLNKTSITGYTLESAVLNATIVPSDANDGKIKWTSSDDSIVSVDNGKLGFKRSGTATITVSMGGKSATCDVTVNSRERIYFISHKETDGTDHITGDAILLESNGAYAMIDMGHGNRSTDIVNFLKSHNVQALDFVLFTHMDSDHAGNFREILESGVKVKNIWMKNYDVASYRENYIPNLDSNGIDHGLEKQNKDVSTYRVNKALARFRYIIYLSEYSKYKDQVGNIKFVSSDEEGTTYSFKNLKFNMTLYNNKRNINAFRSENYNSITSLITVNNHTVLLTGDDFDTKKFNETANKVGKVTVLKVPHHGSGCSLNPRQYDGDRVVKSGGTEVTSTALSKLKARYYVVTSTSKKIDIIKDETESDLGKVKCVDRVYQYDQNANIRFVDETPNALVLELSNPKKITFYSE